MQASLSSIMVTLCLTNLPETYPGVTFLTHNLGGNIPFEIERMDHRCLLDTPDEPLPSSCMSKPGLYMDCNSFGAQAIELGVKLYGADKIQFGTDGEDARNAILHANAVRALSHLTDFAPLSQAAE